MHNNEAYWCTLFREQCFLSLIADQFKAVVIGPEAPRAGGHLESQIWAASCRQLPVLNPELGSIPLSELRPFRESNPRALPRHFPHTLLCTTSTLLSKRMMEIKTMLSYIVAALARLGSPVRPTLLFSHQNQAGAQGRTLGQSSLHQLARKWSDNIIQHLILSL